MKCTLWTVKSSFITFRAQSKAILTQPASLKNDLRSHRITTTEEHTGDSIARLKWLNMTRLWGNIISSVCVCLEHQIRPTERTHSNYYDHVIAILLIPFQMCITQIFVLVCVCDQALKQQHIVIGLYFKKQWDVLYNAEYMPDTGVWMIKTK